MIREGDILICNEDYIKPGTGTTWSFLKGKSYTILKLYTIWKGYEISSERIRDKYGNLPLRCALSEEEIKKHFDYLTIQRRNKIEKILNR